MYQTSGYSEHIYEIGVIDFFNARHSVGDEPVHSHSWRVEVRVRRLRYLGEQSLISIDQVKDTLRRIFARYEDQVLNNVPPFTFQEPTAENLVTYLFEELDKGFRGIDATLYALTVWESPTNYVTYKLST